MRRLFIKVIRDLLKDKFRISISLFAIIFGTSAFGIMLFSYNLTSRELSEGFLRCSPASGSIMVDKIDDKLIEITKSFKEISAFEEKGYYELRIKVGKDQWKTLHLFGFKDFYNTSVNKVFNQKGSFKTGKDEILIERDALGVAETGLNEIITISMPDSSLRDFKITGIVHDLNTHPASVENIIPAYINYDQLDDIGLKGNRIDFILSDNKYDRTSIMSVTNDYIKLLESNGYKVNATDISNAPGKTIHQVEYDAVLFVLQIASILAFLLGCMIMSSLLSTILSSQIRQIGILKSIGAKTEKIFLAYMLVIFSLVLVNIAVSIPLALFVGGNLANIFLKLGNMDLTVKGIPGHLIALYSSMSLIVPIIIAILPIRRGVRISVKEALANYGTTQSNTAESKLLSWSRKTKIFSSTVLLSIRNAARSKSRFYLNLVSLTLGGALFIAAIMSIISMRYTIAKDIETFKYDYQISTSNTVEDAKLSQIIKEFPEVKEFENWGNSSGKIKYQDGKIGNIYTIMAPSSDNRTFEPVMMEGRWLSEGDSNEIVIGHQFYSNESEYKFGDTITLQIGEKEQQFKIVGTIKELGSPTIYVNMSGFEKLIPDANKKNSIKLILQSGVCQKDAVYQKVEDRLKENGVIVFQAESIADLLGVLESHGLLVVVFFLVIAIMILIVSGFGLASTMSVQVSERTKEIGILKAIGASNKQMKRMVVAESIFICIVSWIISIVFGILLGAFIAIAIGNVMVGTALDVDYISSYIPVLIWLALTVFIGYWSSRTAARKAGRMTVKDALTFD